MAGEGNIEIGALDSAKLTILYIDDDDDSLLLMKIALRRAKNIEVITSASAEEGLEKIDQQPVDMVFLDLNMPGMDGTTAMKLMREKSDLTNAPIIAISANADPSYIEKAMQQGFDDYITKPMDLTKLPDIILKYDSNSSGS